MAAMKGCPCCVFALPDNIFLPRSDEAIEAAREDKEIDDELAPILALKRLDATHAPLIDTHCHAHLDRANESEEVEPSPYTDIQEGVERGRRMVIMSCAVSPADWVQCLEYAAQSTTRRAALGVHPWYIDQLLVDNQLSTIWLTELEALVQQHPRCFIGEIGLCKHAKFLRTFQGGKAKALELQHAVLVQQLQLAARYQRPVSVHCVDQQAVLLQILKGLDRLPPAIALHSFTGSAHHIKQLLLWEESLIRDPSADPIVYFGFSHSINYLGSIGSERSRRQTTQAIRQVPQDRLLAESDVHSNRHVAAGTAGAIAFLTWALQQGNAAEASSLLTLEYVSQLTARNATRFFMSLSLAADVEDIELGLCASSIPVQP